MTGEGWDTHWHTIYEDAIAEGYAAGKPLGREKAFELADRECAEQFGPRPADVAS